MSLKNVGKSIVEEVEYGMYVWRLPNDTVLADNDDNVMNIFCLRREQRPAAKKAIQEAARHYGFPFGVAEWWSGKRPITDEELQEQTARAAFGLVADPLDYAAIAEEEKRKHFHG